MDVRDFYVFRQKLNVVGGKEPTNFITYLLKWYSITPNFIFYRLNHKILMIVATSWSATVTYGKVIKI